MISVSPMSGSGHPVPWKIFPKYFWEELVPFGANLLSLILWLQELGCCCFSNVHPSSPVCLWHSPGEKWAVLGPTWLQIPYSLVKSQCIELLLLKCIASTFSSENKIYSTNQCIINIFFDKYLLSSFYVWGTEMCLWNERHSPHT